MKLKYLLSILFFSINMPAQWYWVNNMPPPVIVSQFQSPSSQVVVGKSDKHIMVVSVDSGLTWNSIELPSQEYPRAIHFFDKLNGFIIFLGYQAAKTTDGGNSWSVFLPSQNKLLYDMTFADDSVGYILLNGGFMIKTTDRGNTWVEKTVPASGLQTTLRFYTRSIGKYKVNSTFYYTLDGAETWNTVVPPPGESLHALEIFPDSVFMAATRTKVYISTNYGSTWTLKNDVGGNFTFVSFLSPQSAIIRNTSNTLVITTDSGSTFTTKQLPPYSGVISATLANSLKNIIFATNQGVVYTSQDTGSTWSAFRPQYNFSWNDVNSAATLEITTVVGNHGRIYRIFQQNMYSAVSPTMQNLNAVSAWSTSRVLIAGDNGTILRTIPPSSTFSLSNSGVTSNLYDISLSSTTDVGYAVGDSGVILKTTNMGGNWQSQISGISSTLRSVKLINDTIGFAVGNQGVVLKTTNAGFSWIRHEIGTTANLKSVSSSGQHLLAVGENGACFRSNNLGETWFPSPISETSDINSVAHWNTNSAGLVTESGNLYITSNNGQSWIFERSFPQMGLTNISYYNSYIANISLRNGYMLRRTAVVPVELASFSVRIMDKSVLLEWQTATELNNRGFEIQKSINNTDWVTIAFVPGRGTATSPSDYDYLDTYVEPGILYYRLLQIDYDGTQKIYDAATVVFEPDFSLAQNFPNPFNPETTIEYTLPESTNISLTLYDILGNQVKVLDSGTKNAGKHYYTLKSDGLASGVYYYRLLAGEISIVRKLMVTK